MTRTVVKSGPKVTRAILKLKRNQSSIRKYLEKLKSYRCEPTDYQCFLMVRQLKEGLVDLASNQRRLLDAVTDKQSLTIDELRKMESFEKKYQQLELDMAAYLSQTNKHF